LQANEELKIANSATSKYLHTYICSNINCMEAEKNEKKPIWRKRLIRIGIGLVIGALLGYAYFHFFACSSGGCSITATPTNSILYGMLFGGVIAFK